MVLTLPAILEDYYDEIEQDTFSLIPNQVLSDCNYILDELSIGEWYDYPKSDVSSLKRFCTLLRNNLPCVVILSRY